MILIVILVTAFLVWGICFLIGEKFDSTFGGVEYFEEADEELVFSGEADEPDTPDDAEDETDSTLEPDKNEAE